MAQQAPQIYDLPQLHRQMIEVLGIKNADKLVPIKDDAKPTDPLSENMDVLNLKPVKAFIYQDHEAHIAAHQAFLQDPMIGGMLQQNPQAKQMLASLQAHISEHLAFMYRKKIEERIGADLPAPNTQLPEDIEVSLSRLVSQAATELTQKGKQEQAQKQAEQKAQDPIVQMQQADIQIKQEEVKRKAEKDRLDGELRAAEIKRKSRKDQADAVLGAEELKLEKEELRMSTEKDAVKLAASRRQNNNKIDLELAKLMKEKKE